MWRIACTSVFIAIGPSLLSHLPLPIAARDCCVHLLHLCEHTLDAEVSLHPRSCIRPELRREIRHLKEPQYGFRDLLRCVRGHEKSRNLVINGFGVPSNIGRNHGLSCGHALEDDIREAFGKRWLYKEIDLR